MLHLPNTLEAWNTTAFAAVLTRELAAQAAALPLQQAMTTGSIALDDQIEVILLSVEEAQDTLHIRVGIFYAGIVAGCSCADDPTPVEPQPEYCELDIAIDKATAAASASLTVDGGT